MPNADTTLHPPIAIVQRHLGAGHYETTFHIGYPAGRRSSTVRHRGRFRYDRLPEHAIPQLVRNTIEFIPSNP